MSSQPSIAIHIVTWNGARHIPWCIRAITRQSYPHYSILVVDNGSLDNTVAWLRENAPQVYILQNNRNVGFARGHNQALRLVAAEYALCLNQDVILDEHWLEQAIRLMESKPEIGAYGSRILRYEYDEESLTGIRNSGIIDTAGLQVSRSRHVADRESGRSAAQHQTSSGLVFGVSGACMLLRVSAVQSVRFQDEFFDQDFFSYKEDVDLCWRLQRAGWSIWYDDQSVAYHHRSIRGQSSTGNLSIAKNHAARQLPQSRWSYRNHLLMLIKNETGQTFWPDSLWIVWYEIRKLVFLLFTRPSVLTVWLDVLRRIKMMRSKAKATETQAHRSNREVRRWFLQKTGV